VPVWLGVDGGGTKTAFVLLDERDRVVAEATAPSCYYFAVGIDLVGRVLEQGIAEIERVSGVDRADVEQAFFALPGWGEASADVPELDRIAGAVLGHDRYTCGNDAVAGWAGSLGGADGVNVVAGTGSIAYGEWRGSGARVGGWSEVFGDEGSAYWIAVRGLNAFARMSDGRLPRGPLHARIREAVGAAADLDVIGVVTDGWNGDRGRIAALARVVTAAADAGDAAAQGVVADAGRELAAHVHAARRALAVPDDEELPVSYSGGVFAAPGVRAAFEAALGAGHRLVEPLHGPGVGAALYARKQAAGRRAS
jgi:N-acetylglucosamine kinase-like BadF-type ATPase